ncbi:glycosyltransferase [Rufibacter roseus]|uniref:Glycosyltransferase n=1 Tax=Rufibacter roseus TaxID=1567108 RepID=A0ABW2DNS0_9BACT|nr:glycosyltransferase [Rufibacter roseus]
MRIAYLLSWELGKQDGVTKKVLAQTSEWIKLGHEVTVFCVCKNDSLPNTSVPIIPFKREPASTILKEYFSLKKAHKKVKAALAAFKPDIIYHRAEIPQSALGEIIAKFPTVMEMNTNDMSELRELAKKNLKGKVRFLYYSLIRDRYLGRASGFCCVTNEIGNLSSIKKYKKPIAVIPNTIRTSNYAPAPTQTKAEAPKLLFMGSPDQSWHGTDKILELASKTINDLQFELVGPSKPNYKTPQNINFHGFLKQAEYENIVKSCDVGICTLALHRNNMHEASPLKTREYLAYGLPIILGYKDTAFMEQSPEWVLQLDNTEDNVESNLEEIKAFCFKNKGVRLKNEQVKKYIDVSVYEKKRLAFLESVVLKKK